MSSAGAIREAPIPPRSPTGHVNTQLPTKRRPVSDDTIWPNKIRSGSSSSYSSISRRPSTYPPPEVVDHQSTHADELFPSRQRTRERALNDLEEDMLYDDTRMLLQPETRPISQEQLINEVKGIYAGLVMVEKKCVEICQQQAQTTQKLSNEQWQALIALHRTLLHEHHDFFLASQHPSASASLRRLPTKYAMPARMWRHGIHSFLELLRHRLPYSLEHMLSFVYLAYQMMGLLMESVPAFHETWIECLGDLARYRMAIEEADMRDRETWSNVARTWYNKAADRSPETGRIQHHLAVLARPDMFRQLFYYSKAAAVDDLFSHSLGSIMLLFNPLPARLPVGIQRDLSASGQFSAKVLLDMFTSLKCYHGRCVKSHVVLRNQDSNSTSNRNAQGPEVGASLGAPLTDHPAATSQWNTVARCDHSHRERNGPEGPTFVHFGTDRAKVLAAPRRSTAPLTCMLSDLRKSASVLAEKLIGIALSFASALLRLLSLNRRSAHWPSSTALLFCFSRSLTAHASSPHAKGSKVLPVDDVSWAVFGADLLMASIRASLPWVTPILVCSIFNIWVYAKGPSRRTELLGYGAVIASFADFALFDRNASTSAESKFCVGAETLLLICWYARVSSSFSHGSDKSAIGEFMLALLIAGFAAGALCSLSGGAVTIAQVFPFCALLVVEMKKFLLGLSPVMDDEYPPLSNRGHLLPLYA